MSTQKALIGLLCLSFATISLGETILSYPELEVTPRASERLNMQLAKEKENNLFSQLPMQASAASTFVTGILLMGNVDEAKDPNKKSPNAGIIVGAAWLGVNYYIGQKYHVYEKSASEVTKISGQSNRDQLLKERLAEEGLERASSLAVRMKWISVATNFSANAFMLTKAKKETSAQYMGAIALLSSFAPLVFVSDWETAAADQSAYKKKVYGPILTTSLFETSEGKFSPGFLLSTTF